MALIDITTNWKNFFRQAVGKPKHFPVKVRRNELAKKYPLMGISKNGDVGFDLHSTEEVVVPAMTPEIRDRYLELVGEKRRRQATAERLGLEGAAEAFEAEYEEKLLELLPRAVVPTGIFLEMGECVWCSIEARSSSSQKLLITPDAIIDSGYRGELFGVVFNLGYEEYVVQPGERVVQVIFHEKALADIKEVNKLADSERGTTGFGSSGL